MSDSCTREHPTQPTKLRWAFIGMSALLSLVLAAAMASTFLGARHVATAVASGQGTMLLQAAHNELDLGPPPPGQARLQELIDNHHGFGLRYIALIHPGGPVIVEAGTRAPELEDAEVTGSGALVRRGDVARIASLGRAESKAPPDKGHPWAGPRFHGPGPGGPAPQLILEFEPTMAFDVERRARREMAIGLASIAVLWGSAALFWRLATRTAAAEASLVRQRHFAALGEMSAVMAHELRNPLASLKGHAQLLREQATDSRLADKAQRVVDEAIRLEDLSRGLLEFVRSGKVERAQTSVARVLRDAVLGSIASVEIDDDDAPDAWSLDAPRIRQVLVNLLDNARQAAPDDVVTLRAYGDHATLVIEVRDRGPGVDADMREQIFAPFFTGRTQGTGLGLAVAQRIVEQHGGAITYSDSDHGGAVFTLRIPEDEES